MKKIIALFLTALLFAGCTTIHNTVTTPTGGTTSVTVTTANLESRGDTAKMIKGLEYVFPGDITNVMIDTSDMSALVFMKQASGTKKQNPYTLEYYDLNDQKVRWTKETYSYDGVILQNNIIVQGYNKIYALSKQTGSIVWQREGSYYFKNDAYNVGFYGSLNAINLETGQDSWTHKINNKYGWIQQEFSDSILYAAVDGLHGINIINGKGWDINMPTGKKDVVKAFVINFGLTILYTFAATFGGGIYGANFVRADLYNGMSSEMLFNNEQIFFSAKENLICVDAKSGKMVWQTRLPLKKTASTKLIDDGQNIIVVNKGYCFKNGLKIKYGYPYIAKYDKTTGQQIFLNVVGDNNQIEDVAVTSSGYYLITLSTVYYYDFGGKLITKKDFHTSGNNSYGDLFSYISNPLFYIKNVDNFTPLSNSNFRDSVICIRTADGVLSIDSTLNVKSWHTNQEIFEPTFQYNSTIILQRPETNNPDGTFTKKSFYIIDTSGKLINTISSNLGLINFNNSVFYINGNALNKLTLNP